MKEKTAKLIRIITIPPLEVLTTLLILYGIKRNEFGNVKNLLTVILFLTLIPVCAYPIASRTKSNDDTRTSQRNMAFLFNFLSYLIAMLIGYFRGYSMLMRWILDDYFLSVLVLTIINKAFRVKASGHACSCTLPFLFLNYYLGGYVVGICLILYLAELWASVYLKRHTTTEFLVGSAVAWTVFVGSGLVIFFSLLF